MWTIIKFSYEDTRSSDVFIANFEDVSHFRDVSTVYFEKVFVCWDMTMESVVRISAT